MNQRCTTLSMFAAAMMLLAAMLSATAAETVNPLGKTLDGWLAKGPIEKSKWQIGKAQIDKDNSGKLSVIPAGDEPPAMITPEGHGLDIYTKAKFGDCTVELEVMVPKGSNSGIYLMGEYEVQVLDSFGKKRVGRGDMGGIYGANAPRVNAAGEPGTWQKYVIEFQAPRFNAEGKKTANAQFIKVTLNGQVLHKDVEMRKQTPGGVTGREHPTGPLMFQGNHGAVAYRNIRITPR